MTSATQGSSSQPTLSRFEHAADAATLNRLTTCFERAYVEALPADTDFVLLDIDTTDDPTNGGQQLTFFHGFYDQHMVHPLLVFDGSIVQLVTTLLRPGNAHAARSAMIVLRRVIRAIKARFPHALGVVRGDSGFCVPRVIEGLDRLEREYGEVVYVEGSRTESAASLARAADAARGRGAIRHDETIRAALLVVCLRGEHLHARSACHRQSRAQ